MVRLSGLVVGHVDASRMKGLCNGPPALQRSHSFTPPRWMTAVIRCFREGDFAPSAWFFNTHDFDGPIEARPRPHRSAHFEPIGLLEEQGPPGRHGQGSGKEIIPGTAPALRSAKSTGIPR